MKLREKMPLILLFLAALTASSCASSSPTPRYKPRRPYPNAVWVPGHRAPGGEWSPGHWK